MAAERPSQRRYRCRLCGETLAAWLPVPQRPNTARLLHHIAQDHRGEGAVTAALDRMRSQADIEAILLAELFAAVAGEG